MQRHLQNNFRSHITKLLTDDPSQGASMVATTVMHASITRPVSMPS